MTYLDKIHSLAMAAIERMSGGQIVLALLVLVAGAVALVMVPSPVHDRLQVLMGRTPAPTRRRTRKA